MSEGLNGFGEVFEARYESMGLPFVMVEGERDGVDAFVADLKEECPVGGVTFPWYLSGSFVKAAAEKHGVKVGFGRPPR